MVLRESHLRNDDDERFKVVKFQGNFSEALFNVFSVKPVI